MSIFELLHLILQAGVQNDEHGSLQTSLNYDTGTVTLTQSIGPIEPRTRTVTISPDNVITATAAQVVYQEISHGTPQAPSEATSDLTNAVEVSRLIGRIWTHLKG